MFSDLPAGARPCEHTRGGGAGAQEIRAARGLIADWGDRRLVAGLVEPIQAQEDDGPLRSAAVAQLQGLQVAVHAGTWHQVSTVTF